jgi:hypothetical protein
MLDKRAEQHLNRIVGENKKKPGALRFNFLCVCIEKTALQCSQYLPRGTLWVKNSYVDNYVTFVGNFLKGVT